MSHVLLDRLLLVLDLKNTQALAEYLEVSPALLSKLRAGARKVSAELILTIYDKSGMSLDAIRTLAKEANGTNA